MVRTGRSGGARLLLRRFARAVATTGIVGALALALPALSGVTPDLPLPSHATHAAEGQPRLDRGAVPVRVRVPAIGIDLPVVSSERNVRGNPGNYPLCDVAQYWTRYDLPGAPGTAWIYAHAQPGMFLPLFTTAEATDGDGLMGKVIEVQLKDGRLLRYRIKEVRQRAVNRRIAQRDGPNQHRLILQTSTGPPGTVPKLQVAATLIGARRTDEAAPRPRPRACSQAADPRGSDATDRPSREPGASPGPTTQGDEETDDPAPFVVGSIAVLLGATLVAVALVRRSPSR